MKRSAVTFLLVVAVVVGVAGPAWAPRTMLLPPLQDVPCTLPDGGSGTFDGEASVTGFVEGKSGPEALTQISGACSTSTGTVLDLAPANPLPLAAKIHSASCTGIELQLGPAVTAARDGFAEIAPFTMAVDNEAGTKKMNNALCGAAKTIAKDKKVKNVVKALNKILDAQPPE